MRPKAGTSRAAAAHRGNLFVEAFIANGGNATAAAKSAGYSSKTARRQGSRLLSDVHISEAIAARQRELVHTCGLTTEAVIRSIANALFFDPRKLYHPDGSLKDIHELDDATADALAGMEVVATAGSDEKAGGMLIQTRKIRWESKSTARDQALKFLGLYQKDNDQRKPGGIYSLTMAELEKIARGR